MKAVKSRVAQVEDKVFKTANNITFEGDKSWTIKDSERLKQYAMTGVLGRTFYSSQKDVIDEAIKLIKNADATDLSEAIVIGRNVGFIRSFPILGLVYLSSKDINLFKSVFNDVIKTGNDLGDFIDLCRKMRGFGRGIKTAIINWLNKNVSPYYALKYRKQLADAIRLSRIKGEDSIYAFILRDKIEVSKDKLLKSYEEYPEFKAFDDIPKMIEDKNFNGIAENIVKYRLDVDSLTGYYNKFDKTVWESIAQQSPVMRFIKYLNKFERVGIDVSEYAKQKITVENLKRAKVFPFRLFMAWKELSSVNNNVSNILAKVLDDYVKQYDWNEFNNSTWAICPDVSGSMSNVCGSNGNLRYIDIAGMFTAFFAKGLNNVAVLPWSNDVVGYKIPHQDSVISQMNFIESIGGGGTNMSASISYMIKNKIKRDFCVFITDTESYNEKSHWGCSGTSWIEAWIKYKSYNPKAKAIIIRGDIYNNQPMSEEQCQKYDIYQIFGWNDSVVNYIQSILK